MPILRFNRPLLCVSNMERSLEFYCGKLGMAVLSDNRIQDAFREPLAKAMGLTDLDIRWVYMEVPGGSSRLGVGREVELLHWIKPEWKPLPPNPNPPVMGVPVAWIAFTVERLEELYNELKSKGVQFRGPIAKFRADRGICYAIDPDGYTVELGGTI